MTDPAGIFLTEFGIEFSDPELIRRAFRHPSATVETGSGESYQRLEFLGDAILGQVVAENLFKRHPRYEEGRLSRMKGSIVSTATLSRAARRLGFSRLVTADTALFDQDGRLESDAILEDVFEAAIAAIYLDRGFGAAKAWILDALADDLAKADSEGLELDAKSSLQQALLKRFQLLPEYEMLEQSGPPHKRTFTVRCVCRGAELGKGSGPSLQAAQQEAAGRALEEIEETYQRIEEALKD